MRYLLCFYDFFELGLLCFLFIERFFECSFLLVDAFLDLFKFLLLLVDSFFDWFEFVLLQSEAFFYLALTPFYPVNPFFQSADLNFKVFTLGIRYGFDLGMHHFEFVLHHSLLVLEFSAPVVTVNLVRLEVNRWLNYVEEITLLLNAIEIGG